MALQKTSKLYYAKDITDKGLKQTFWESLPIEITVAQIGTQVPNMPRVLLICVCVCVWLCFNLHTISLYGCLVHSGQRYKQKTVLAHFHQDLSLFSLSDNSSLAGMGEYSLSLWFVYINPFWEKNWQLVLVPINHFIAALIIFKAVYKTTLFWTNLTFYFFLFVLFLNLKKFFKLFCFLWLC